MRLLLIFLGILNDRDVCKGICDFGLDGDVGVGGRCGKRVDALSC